MCISDWSSDVCSSDLVAGDRCQIGIIDKSALRNDACANRADRPNRPAKGDLGFNPMRGRPGEPIISVSRVRQKPCALLGVGQTAGEIVGLPQNGATLYAIKDSPLSVTLSTPHNNPIQDRKTVHQGKRGE